MTEYAINLPGSKLPDAWYNIAADLPTPVPPPLHPATHKPLIASDLAAIFPENLIEQEMSTERWVSIPGEVMDAYKLWRPTPLRRAFRLEKALNTPAKIFYKNESVSPSGSHKLNTAVAQAYYNKISGVNTLTTETGAGQWGTALSIACSMFDMHCTVYMVKVSYEQKPYRRSLIQTFGAEIVPSPSDTTDFGSAYLKAHPDSPGALGIAISEAVEVAVKSGGSIRYSLGSVLNHVMLHQSIIGEEAMLQMDSIGEYPDVVIGCCGGGSNLAGLSFPYAREKFSGNDVRLIAVEPSACPTLTRGVYGYDFGDTGELTPLLIQYTLGHSFIPPSIHSGGLRYHGVASQVAHLVHGGYMEAVGLQQTAVFDAGLMFARCEGIVPAPESCHAIRSAIDEAERCRESGEAKTILFNLSGHGHFDMSSYEAYLSGGLTDYDLEESLIQEATKDILPLATP